MCGIAGYIGKRPPSDDAVRCTLELMRNRGPDVQQAVRIEDHGAHVVLLHSRLTILDLDARSNQPFTIGDCTLTYNGEIYNFVELRAGLERRGVAFHTTSDTEMLVQAYRERGASCVESFEGMWSFALYDRRRGELLLSRDRFGEKPLYWTELPEGFAFASEVKFLRALTGVQFPVNRRQLLRYIVNGYKSLYKSGETFFEGVGELPPGHNLFVKAASGSRRLERYWTPRVATRPMLLADAVDGFRERLVDSMRLRLRADVPVAFCLSGGVDSAGLVSIATKCLHYDVATFSIIDSDERYNEYDNVMATVRDTGCRSTLIDIPRDDPLGRLERLVRYHDAPVYTISYYVHALISEAVSRGGFRVAVSGTGADELVTGYYDHFILHLHEMRGHPDYQQVLADWRTHVQPLVRNPHLSDPELYDKDPGFRDHIYLRNDEFASYLKEPFAEEFSEVRYGASLLRDRMLNELFHEAVPVMLHEDDRNSMLWSVENRSPYLDTRLFDFAFSIPPEHLVRGGYGKWVLRESLKGILNDQVRLDHRKKGFNASIHSVVDLDTDEARARLLDVRPLYDLIDRRRMEALLRQRPLPNSDSKFVFNVLNAGMFLAQHG